jgi:hypothetical protein
LVLACHTSDDPACPHLASLQGQVWAQLGELALAEMV